MQRISMLGQKFGKLTVVELVGKMGTHLMYRCVCDCGTEHVARGSHLRYAQVTSCGCTLREVNVPRMIAARTTHGHTNGGIHTPTYKTWSMMLSRCNNPKATGYHNYGGRGIRVCKRWHKFENFLADMGPRPPGMTIDRKNVNGHYTKRNCRWATARQQSANKR